MTRPRDYGKGYLNAREAVPATKRRPMTRTRKKAVLEAFGGLCRACGCPLVITTAEIDHIIPIELGGSDEIENLQALCAADHREKTKADIKRIAKARRLRKREENPPDPTRPNRIKSRGFVKHISKGFDGKIKTRVPKVDPGNQ